MSGAGLMVTEVMYRDEIIPLRVGQVALGFAPTGRRFVGLKKLNGLREWWVGSQKDNRAQYYGSWEDFTFERWQPSKHGQIPEGTWVTLSSVGYETPAPRFTGTVR